MLGGGFEQERVGAGAGGGIRDFSTCAGKLQILKSDKFDGCRKTSYLYITCLVMFLGQKDLMFDVVLNTINVHTLGSGEPSHPPLPMPTYRFFMVLVIQT